MQATRGPAGWIVLLLGSPLKLRTEAARMFHFFNTMANRTDKRKFAFNASPAYIIFLDYEKFRYVSTDTTISMITISSFHIFLIIPNSWLIKAGLLCQNLLDLECPGILAFKNCTNISRLEILSLIANPSQLREL